MKAIRSLEVLPAVVVRRDADAREGAEDRHPRRGQAGVVAAPVRRVGRQREQDRHVHAHPVGDVDRLVGVVEADVDVQPEDDLLARDEPQRLHQVAVARRARDQLVLPARDRVRAGGADAQALRLGGVANLTPQRAQRGARLAHVRARLGRDLEHGLQQLRLDLAVGRVLEQVVDRVDQRVAVRIEDHQLLLDPDRVRGAAELRLHVAAYSTRLTVRTTSRGNRRWPSATTGSCTSWPSTTEGRSRRRCSGSRAIRRRRRPRRSPTPRS